MTIALNSAVAFSEKFFYVNMSTNGFCEGTPQWRCLAAWRQTTSEYTHFFNAKASRAMESVGLSPAAVGIIIIVSTVIALYAIGYGVVNRLRLRAQLVRLEEELRVLRESKTERSAEDRVPLQQLAEDSSRFL